MGLYGTTPLPTRDQSDSQGAAYRFRKKVGVRDQNPRVRGEEDGLRMCRKVRVRDVRVRGLRVAGTGPTAVRAPPLPRHREDRSPQGLDAELPERQVDLRRPPLEVRLPREREVQLEQRPLRAVVQRERVRTQGLLVVTRPSAPRHLGV